MRVARISTILFGLGTIAIAFLVPLAGGIVEVVLSIAAITGGALYGPAIWALFSNKQTGNSILGVTMISLLINVFFKFITPKVFNFALNRTEELILGVGIPFLLLVAYEIIAPKSVKNSILKEDLKSIIENKSDETGQNKFGIKVLGSSLIAIGTMFFLLSFWGGDAFSYLVMIGLSIMGLGVFLHRKAKINKEI